MDAIRKNRGYPDYIRAGDEYDTQVRKLQMAESTMLLSKYCAIPDLTPRLIDFYSKMSSNVRRIGGWPSNLRDDKSSVRLYKALLDNADSLDMPSEVKQLFRCVMVLPASNGDPERTFSTANRLTSGYRSSFSAKTLNSIPHIQRNGPSLLSVDPAKLAMQWTDPRDGLRKHHRSHRGNEYSLMHDVKSAFMENKLNKMDGMKNILQSSKDYDSVFKMIGGYEKHNTLPKTRRTMMTLCTFNACTLASEAFIEDLMMQARNIRYYVIGLTETRRHRPLSATREELFLGTCDRRGIGGVGVLGNTNLVMNIDSFEQLTTRIGRLRLRRCGGRCGSMPENA
ncbi:hypothetical protein ANCCAN_21352 [Ancylostoma caninum]|uniref:HAT C-terminal dimerisation domain-containing protein n=1 Tax=Ancylostoma caninum TaxID=29170 RepID=A0A368FP80_ANCCA|nr:hypothetical protein ANCCAN_21352 [Ancylostoma caninum]